MAHSIARVSLEFYLVAQPDRGLEEILTAYAVREHVCAPIPTAHDVVDGPWKVNSQWVWHAGLFSWSEENVKNKQILLRFGAVTKVRPSARPGA